MTHGQGRQIKFLKVCINDTDFCESSANSNERAAGYQFESNELISVSSRVPEKLYFLINPICIFEIMIFDMLLSVRNAECVTTIQKKNNSE